MTITDWLAAACADADQRGLSDLKPLLESLARSTAALRRAEEAVLAERDDDEPSGDSEA